MRILLTGASGFIGLHTLRALRQHGHEVTAVVRSANRLGPLGRDPHVAVVETDLEQATDLVALLSGHAVCVHAALIWGDPAAEERGVDTEVATGIFGAARDAGLQRSIYISSAAVHRPFVGEMGEDDPLDPSDIYGLTKLAGEQALRQACAQGQMRGIVVRPGPVVGPPAFPGGAHRTPNQISDLLAAARAGQPIEVVQGGGRQLTDVLELARSIRILTTLEDPESTYLCVDRSLTPWEEIARGVAECVDPPSEVRVLPPPEPTSTPRFRTARIERLLGDSSAAGASLRAHLEALTRS